MQSHSRREAVEWGVLRGWAPGIALGAVAGMLTVSSLSSTALQALFGSLALGVGLYMALGRPDWRIAQAMPGLWGRSAMSLGVGFLSALMGSGAAASGRPS